MNKKSKRIFVICIIVLIVLTMAASSISILR